MVEVVTDLGMVLNGSWLLQIQSTANISCTGYSRKRLLAALGTVVNEQVLAVQVLAA